MKSLVSNNETVDNKRKKWIYIVCCVCGCGVLLGILVYLGLLVHAIINMGSEYQHQRNQTQN